MPLYLREGAVIPMGPDLRWVGERLAVRYQAADGRHRVEVDGHRGRVVLDAPAGVELRP